MSPISFDLTKTHPLILIAIAAWTLAWKGLALWRAARNSDRNWFIVILVVNTIGLLDIAYYYVFSNKKHPVYKYLKDITKSIPFLNQS